MSSLDELVFLPSIDREKLARQIVRDDKWETVCAHLNIEPGYIRDLADRPSPISYARAFVNHVIMEREHHAAPITQRRFAMALKKAKCYGSLYVFFPQACQELSPDRYEAYRKHDIAVEKRNKILASTTDEERRQFKVRRHQVRKAWLSPIAEHNLAEALSIEHKWAVIAGAVGHGPEYIRACCYEQTEYEFAQKLVGKLHNRFTRDEIKVLLAGNGMQDIAEHLDEQELNYWSQVEARKGFTAGELAAAAKALKKEDEEQAEEEDDDEMSPAEAD